MSELDELIRQHELRGFRLISHLRRIRGTLEAEIERLYLRALLEDLAILKGERQRREDVFAKQCAA